MIVGTLRIQILIPGARSLKEKRKIVKSIKERIKNRFNISVAEINFQEKWQRAEIGFAQIGNEQHNIEKNLNLIYQHLLGNYNIQVIDKLIEFY